MRQNRVFLVPVLTLVLAGSLGTGIAFAIQVRKESSPSRRQIASIPPIDSPEVVAAVDQTRQVIEDLWSNEWKPGRNFHRLMNLPAQFRSESPGARDPRQAAYVLPSKPGEYPFEDIAIYSEVYVRKNILHKGDNALARPTGYYIVGWRDGRVEIVSVDKVRKIKLDNKGTEALLFPGVVERPVGTQEP